MNEIPPEERFTPDFNSMIQIAILTSLGFFFLGFLVPVIARTLMNASGFEVGLVLSSLTFGYMVSSSFTGYLTDKLDSKKVLVFIGSLGRGTSYFILYLALFFNSIIPLAIGMFTLGFGAGFFWIPYDTLIAEKSNKNHRSQAYGKRDSANAMGQLIGALLGFGFLMGLSFFTSNPLLLYLPIVVYGFLNVIAGFLFLKRVDESIVFEHKKASRDSLMESVSEEQEPFKLSQFPRAMLIGMGILFFVVLLSAINGNLWRPFLNIYILENITSNLNIVILVYLPSGIIATLLAPKLGELMDRLNPATGIIVTSSIGALMTWFLINTTNLYIFALVLLLDITISMAAGLLFRNILSRINVTHRGKILGFTQVFTNLGSVLGPLLGGFTWDALGPTSPFIISIFVELLLIPLYLLVVRLLKPYMAEQYEENTKDN